MESLVPTQSQPNLQARSAAGESAPKKLVIWGASGHALVVADIVRLCGDYEIVGFLDDINLNRRNTIFCGAPILGGREQLEPLADAGVEHILLGFGDCLARLRLSELVRAKGFKLALAVHPRAIVAAGVCLSPGTVVAAGAVVNPGSTIGESVIVNTCASVDHECIVESGAHICPGARLAGGVTVGQGAWIGIGATVIERVHIGRHSTIGAGSVVLKDVPDGVIAYGVPAQVIRRNPSYDS
jgi:acetyltransferase EpsM